MIYIIKSMNWHCLSKLDEYFEDASITVTHPEIGEWFGNSRKTSEPVLTETIPFNSISLIENSTFLRQKYVKDKLSIRRLAQETGHSASYIFESLKRFGIKRESKV